MQARTSFPTCLEIGPLDGEGCGVAVSLRKIAFVVRQLPDFAKLSNGRRWTGRETRQLAGEGGRSGRPGRQISIASEALVDGGTELAWLDGEEAPVD